MNKKKTKRNRREDNGFAAWGGYMEAKKLKLEDQYLRQTVKEGTQQSDIFKNIAIFVNGYTVPTADELKRIMMVHGGIYHHYESKSTTHIIASNLPNVKIKRLKEHNIVKPNWIVDSVAAGKLLDFRKYLLYSNRSKSQPGLFFPIGGKSCGNASEQTDNLEKLQNPECSKAQCKSFQLEDENLECLRISDVAVSNSKNVDKNEKIISGNDEVVNTSKSNVKSQNTCESASTNRTAVNPQFLSEFYGNSRLHHLSTMGAMFKDYVRRLREHSTGTFSGIDRLSQWKKSQKNGRAMHHEDDLVEDFMDDSLSIENNTCGVQGLKTIMHVDMDCFFVSVGLRNRPELQGLPVAVTHAKGNPTTVRSGANRQFEVQFYQQRFRNRLKQKEGANLTEVKIDRKSRFDEVSELDSLSEIASCNYEARKAGVKNGMFFGTALKLCPNLKTIPYDFDGYKEVSYKLYDILASYTLNIEAVSCDEMYVDCTDILKKTNTTALEFATFLREEIKAATGCTASSGFGSNPLQARLATKKAKPNGQFYLEPCHVKRFMHDFKVEDLPGVGSSLAFRLHAEGILTCRDLQRLPLSFLQRKFGVKIGEALHRHCRGEDNRALDICHQRKSVSAEVNYGIRFSEQNEAEAFLKQLSEEVVSRMKEAKVKGRHITLKLMVRAKNAPLETAKFMGHGACDNISRSSTLAIATDDPHIIFREAVALERQLKVQPSDLRGIGIQMSRLSTVNNTVKNTVLTNFLGLQNQTCSKSISNNKEKDATTLDKVTETNIPKEMYTSDVRSEDNYIVHNNDNRCKTPEEKKDNGLDVQSTDVSNIFQEALKNGLMKTSISTDLIGSSVGTKSQCVTELPTLVDVPMMTLSQARKLIRAWIAIEDDPQECDILMFASYTQRLVQAHHLEDLGIIFSLLYRSLVKMETKWKTAYKCIVKHTQEMMQSIYGAELSIPDL